jgi:hypothetical protein
VGLRAGLDEYREDKTVLFLPGFEPRNFQGVQCSETNMMHVLLSLLRIKGFYMFRALLAHPQEALNKRHLVYCVRVMSVGCY